jgi:predicted nucleotidyltransferase
VVVLDGERVLADAVEAYRAALGDRLLAAYALGSLAHGGFSALVSDVDLGLIVSDPLRPDDAARIHAVAEAQKRRGLPLHERLSVFWGTPSTLAGEREGGRFPPLDLLDLIESGRLLMGADDIRPALRHPDRRELVVTGAEFAIDFLAGIRPATDSSTARLGSLQVADADAARELLCPELLVDRGVRRVSKVVLFPVRFLYTAATGQVGTNDAAVAHYLARPTSRCKRLVEAALVWRSEPPSADGSAVELLRAQIVALYLEYIDDYITRLRGFGREDLAGAFVEWRTRLVDPRLTSAAL